MNFSAYIEKLRRKPARERERIAVYATAFAFLIILGIWLVSFSESNKQSTAAAPSSDISSQLDDLKNNFGQGKQSIQDMMQSLPQSTSAMDNSTGSRQNAQINGAQNTESSSVGDAQSQDTSNQSQDTSAQIQDNSSAQAPPSNDSQNNQPEIPQLP